MKNPCLQCEKPQWVRSLCKVHYSKWREENLPPSRVCSLEDCEGTHFGRGYCRPHYMRWKRNGDAEWVAPPPKNTLPCEEPDCPEMQAVLGYCKPHYYRRQNRWDATGWKSALTRNYNITPEEYEQMLEAQGGQCAICNGSNDSKKKRLAVDHDHACCPESGKSCGSCIRGLLCDDCNIGKFKEDPELLRAAANYFESKK